MERYVTQKELAELVGYSPRRLRDINKSLPDESKFFVLDSSGKCDVKIFVERWVRFNIDREIIASSDLEQVRAEHEMIKIQKTKLEVEKMRGSMVSVDDLKVLWGNIADTVRNNFLSLSNRVSPQLVMIDDVPTISNIIDKEVYKILEEVADTPLPDYEAKEEPEETEE